MIRARAAACYFIWAATIRIPWQTMGKRGSIEFQQRRKADHQILMQPDLQAREEDALRRQKDLPVVGIVLGSEIFPFHGDK